MAEMDRLSFQPERFQTAALQSSLQQQARPTLQQQQEQQQQQETPTIVMQNETQDEKPSIEEINKQSKCNVLTNKKINHSFLKNKNFQQSKTFGVG